jgi:excisionase family DNA binding protein
MAGSLTRSAKRRGTAARPARQAVAQRAKAEGGGAAQGGDLIDMDRAIQLLATTRPTFYRWLRAGKIKGMKLGRQWRFYREDIDRFLKGEEPRIELRADIGPLIERLQDRLRQLGGRDPSPPDAIETLRAATLMIALGVAMRASDMHVAPDLSPDGNGTRARLRYRVDGVLHAVEELDVRLLPAIVEQFKSLADCDPHEVVRPQMGRVLTNLGDGSTPFDVRVCFLPTPFGESLTARMLSLKDVSLSLNRIDYSPRDKERLLRWLAAPWGLVIVTGPAGCGKTTVLYSCLHHLASPQTKIMSVEDPVEYRLPGVVQVQVNEAAGLTFSAALRSIMRSDPDVIMLGEVRDAASFRLALQAALSGHLVLTQFHVDNAVDVLRRMVDLGCEPFLVADATKLIVAQLLVRLLCPDCCVKDDPPADSLKRAEELARRGGLDWDGLPRDFRKPVGCPKCGQTGFRSRNVMAEALEVTPEVAAALRRGATGDELRTIAMGQGMTTIGADGVRRAAEGKTSLDEVVRMFAMR